MIYVADGKELSGYISHSVKSNAVKLAVKINQINRPVRIDFITLYPVTFSINGEVIW